MSVPTKIDDLKQVVNADQPNNLTEINQSLKSINKLTMPQIQSNQTYLKDAFDTIIPSLVQSTMLLSPSAGTSQLSEAARQIKNFRDKYSQVIKPTYKKQLTEIVQQIEQKRDQKKLQNFVDTRQSLKKNIGINSLIKAPQQIVSIQFQKKKQNPNRVLTIQQQIQPIRSIVSRNVTSVGSFERAPQSLRILNQFAQSQGYMGMGSTTQQSGRAYIGRYSVKQGENQYIFPYPKNEITSGQTPDLLNNYKFYAGNAINSWNNFVTAQSKFVDYAKKISNRQSRKKFIQDQISSMNIATFTCQALSTLVYYYMMVPLQNYVKYHYQTYDGTKQSFLNNYSVGEKVSRNPFLLNSDNGKKLMNMLIVLKQPKQLWKQVDQFIKSIQTPINRSKVQSFRLYPSKKEHQAKAYFSNIGLTQQQSQKALRNPNIIGIKFKKFMLPSTFTNLQIVQIIQKVTKKQDQKIKKWQLIWGAQKIMCHDYVWQYKL